MKQLLLLLIFIIFSQTTSAQENKNSIVVGGSLRLLMHRNSNANTNIFNENIRKITLLDISPYLGKAVNQKWLFGLQLNYSYFKNSQQQTTESKNISNIFGFSFFGRYIFTPQKRLHLYMKPYFGYNVRKQKSYKNDNLDNTSVSYFLKTGVDYGLLYNVNNKLNAILRVGGIYFSSGKSKNSMNDKLVHFNTFVTSFNLSSISFGVEVNL